MTQESDELTAVQLCQAQTRLRRMVGELLVGSRLEIRERNKALAISNPLNSERGRIYIRYATGEVSLRQTVWDYWGYLDGYGRALWADPDSEPCVNAGRIIAVLDGRLDVTGCDR
jgi:hypothetical protein